MKKSYLLLVPALLFIELVYSQNNIQFEDPFEKVLDMKLFHRPISIKGKLKSKTRYWYNINGRLDANKRFWHYAPKELIFKIVNKYDNSGNVIEVSEYDKMNNLTSKQKYNSKGSIIEEVRTYDTTKNYWEEQRKNDPPCCIRRYIYNYDSNGTLIEKREGDESQRTFLSQSYKYDDKGNKIEEVSYKTGPLPEKIIYKYDSIGNIIEEVSYDKNGIIHKKKNYQYNGSGNKIEENYFDHKNWGRLKIDRKSINIQDPNFEYMLTATSTFNYDLKGNLIQESNFFPKDSLENRLIYKYDLIGNQIENIFYNADGTIVWKRNYAYNSSRNIIEYTQNKNGAKEKYTCKYDSLGNIIDLVYYFSSKLSDGYKLVNKESFKYNSLGDMIEVSKYDEKGILQSRDTFNYDALGNLIEKIVFERVNENVFVKKRLDIFSLEYY
jgi:hypothetical protein